MKLTVDLRLLLVLAIAVGLGVWIYHDQARYAAAKNERLSSYGPITTDGTVSAFTCNGIGWVCANRVAGKTQDGKEIQIGTVWFTKSAVFPKGTKLKLGCGWWGSIEAEVVDGPITE